jgi:predicted AlkP superfamily phosphohydrolase/phosphomutase/tetratricopeptide (TPR) repeat protein
LSDRLAQRVLLIGWDGADWRMFNPLLEKGQMPNLERFINEGVMGNVASLTPMLSPILWTSIATGKYADKHQILGFAEPDGTSGKTRPVSSASRRCKALWNILSDRGLKAGVVSWLASHPAEPINGFVVTDHFAHAAHEPGQPWQPVERSVHPPELLEEACKFRVHPAQTTAMQVAPFVAKLAEFDAVKEPKVQELRVLLAECATTHAVATWLMQTQKWDFLGIYYEALDRFAHAFMEFHPPKAPHLSDEEFERYKDVMTGCYRFHDLMLGRLMQLAGDETTVIIVSDHGFHSDHLRPEGSSKIHEGRPVAWHRRYGVVAMRGPHIKKDQRVYGASLLDVTPTILTLLGCPVARDMDGKPLRQIFDGETVEVQEIDTYETPGQAASADAAEDPWLARQVLARLVDLGYIENDSTEGVALDRARNLGQLYAATGRPKRAIEQYEQVLAKKPDDKGCKISIAACRLQMGQLAAAEQLVSQLLTDEADAPLANYYLGVIHFRRGDTDAALQHLRRAEAANPGWIELQCQIGQVYLRRQRWKQAEAAFKKALEIDVDSAEAHDGLGVAYRAQKRPEEAVHEHMLSIALLHYRPQTHINLGLALAETGQFDWAIRAFEVALEQNPHHPFPHRCLAQIYRRAKHDPQKAMEHVVRARELIAARRRAMAAVQPDSERQSKEE